jgi:hypothetical protein
MRSSPEPRRVVGVVIFMATFIVGALIVEALDRYQADGWSGLAPIVWAVLLGSLAGLAIEMLDVSFEKKARIASKVSRVVLGLVCLTVVIAGLAFVWDSDTSLKIFLPVAAGIGLTRLSLQMWRLLRRQSRARAFAASSGESRETWR